MYRICSLSTLQIESECEKLKYNSIKQRFWILNNSHLYCFPLNDCLARSKKSFFFPVFAVYVFYCYCSYFFSFFMLLLEHRMFLHFLAFLILTRVEIFFLTTIFRKLLQKHLNKFHRNEVLLHGILKRCLSKRAVQIIL